MAENAELSRLVVSLEARINQYDKAMRRATGQTDKTARRIESRFNKMNSAVAAQFKVLATRLAAPLLAGGAIGGFQAVARDIASIGDEAKRAGVNVRAFQELEFVAQQNRIGIDALTDGLKELSLRADEFIQTGAGPAAEAFARLGYDADLLSEKLADPSALFAEIIGKLEQMDQAAQIRIADEVFGGTGGEKFVQLIEEGRQGIEDTIREANELGLVLDEELIDRADELDRKFNAISETVGTALKRAIVDAAGALDIFIKAFGDFVSDASNRGAGLNGNQRLDEVLKATNPQGWNRLRSDVQGAFYDVPRTNFYEGFTFGPDGNILVDRGGSGGGGSSTDKPDEAAIRAAERRRQAVADLIEQLEFEKRVLGLTDVEREVEVKLREAGAAATEEQRQQIGVLVTAIAAETAALERTNEQMREFRDVAKTAMRTFIDDLIEGKSAADAFANALHGIGNRLIDAGLSAPVGTIFTIEWADAA